MKIVKRDVLKFLSGLFAGLAIEHAVVAAYIAAGVLNRPRFLGREWGPESGVVGAVFYLVISVWLGYLGWRSVTSAESEPARR